MSAGGWLKLHRKLRESPIWRGATPTQKIVWLETLLSANFSETKHWDGETGREVVIPAGAFVTTLRAFAGLAGVSEKGVRSAWARLVAHGAISQRAQRRYTVITVTAWTYYQADDDEGIQRARDGQSDGTCGGTCGGQSDGQPYSVNKEEQKKEESLTREGGEVETEEKSQNGIWDETDRKAVYASAPKAWRGPLRSKASVVETHPPARVIGHILDVLRGRKKPKDADDGMRRLLWRLRNGKTPSGDHYDEAKKRLRRAAG